MNLRIKTIALVFLWILSPPIFAQQDDENEPVAEPASDQSETKEKVLRYVTDTLRLSMNTEPNSTSDRVKLLTSGDVLELGEKSGGYAFVTTKDNLSGWVKSLFLEENPTASFLIKEEISKNVLLIEELKKFNDSKSVIERNEKEIATLKLENNELANRASAMSNELELLKVQMADRENEIQQEKEQTSKAVDWLVLLKLNWKEVLLAILLLFGVGFLSGKILAEAKIKKKFQGIKVW